MLVSAAVILTPVVAYVVFLTIYDYRRRRRIRHAAQRPTVAHIAARIATETAEPDHTGIAQRARGGAAGLTLKRQAGQAVDVPRLPPGWHWPSRDPDQQQPHPTAWDDG